jgi:uncharacterized protein
MPLLTSPIDGLPMRQIHRFGIEIDVCQTSGGIWLDKGELEKLMVLLKEEANNDQSNSPARTRTAHQSQSRPADYDDEDDDDHRRHGRGGNMSRIMDIFDF